MNRNAQIDVDSDYESMFGGTSDDECSAGSAINHLSDDEFSADPPINKSIINSMAETSDCTLIDGNNNSKKICSLPTPILREGDKNCTLENKEKASKQGSDLRGEPSSSKSATTSTIFIDESLFASSSDEEETMPEKKSTEAKISEKNESSLKITGSNQSSHYALQGLSMSPSVAIPKKKRKPSGSISNPFILEENQTDSTTKFTPASIMKEETFSKIASHRFFPKSVHKNSRCVAGPLRPDQYPIIHEEQYWQTLRSWDFVNDLNDHNNTHSKDCADETQSNELLTNASDDNSREAKTKEHRSSNPSPFISPLPNCFDSFQHYAALWAPLQLQEAKAQILSDVCSSNIPLPRMLIPVNVTPVLKANNDEYAECLSLLIRPNNQAGGHSTQLTAKNGPSRQDIVLLVTDVATIEKAWKGSLYSKLENKKKKVSWSPSLISFQSPFIENRLGIIGQVRKKMERSVLTVQISRRLWRKTATEPSNMFLLRLGYNFTAHREFNALCNVNGMPLMKYLLNPKYGSDKKPSSSSGNDDGPLSEKGGKNALGIGFRIWVKSRFNGSQLNAINAAAREYGDGGFTLVKGPPGTGKTTTLVALLNALHSRQYQRYYSEIERITLAATSDFSMAETLAAIHAAAKVKPRILACAPSNPAVDNLILKIIEDRFVDGNGGKYSPSIIRVGSGQSAAVASVSLKERVDCVVSESSNMENLNESVDSCRNEVKRLQKEIQNLQRRVRLIAKASPHVLSKDWEIRIDEKNFKQNPRVIFVNHALKTVSLVCPSPPKQGEMLRTAKEMPHYRDCMNSLVKYIERYSSMYSKLQQLVLVQNTATYLGNSNYSQAMVDLNQQLETHILDSSHMVMTTLGSAGSKAIEMAAKFEVVVIDEAAQSSEPSTLPAFQLGSSHAILVGDPQQLPATIFSVSGRSTKYDRSLFQRLEESGHEVHLLDIQYRMIPEISSFPRKIFYGGYLKDGPNVIHPEYGNPLRSLVCSNFPAFNPFTVFDLDSREERGLSSLSNATEARFALHLFKNLMTNTQSLSNQTRISIITPYSQQMTLLKQTFSKLESKYGRAVEINTVDAFQGRESNIVIFSCVRAAGSKGIGFLSDVRRMNVALTRAKVFLFLITRCESVVVNSYWKELVTHAQGQGAVLKICLNKKKNSVQEFPDLKKLNRISATNKSTFRPVEEKGKKKRKRKRKQWKINGRK